MNLGLTETIFLVVLGLLLFGPKKLPQIGRQLGKALAEFKRASNEFQSQLNDEVRKLELEEAVKSPEVKAPAGTAARETPDDGLEATSGGHSGETPDAAPDPETEPQHG